MNMDSVPNSTHSLYSPMVISDAEEEPTGKWEWSHMKDSSSEGEESSWRKWSPHKKRPQWDGIVEEIKTPPWKVEKEEDTEEEKEDTEEEKEDTEEEKEDTEEDMEEREGANMEWTPTREMEEEQPRVIVIRPRITITLPINLYLRGPSRNSYRLRGIKKRRTSRRGVIPTGM